MSGTADQVELVHLPPGDLIPSPNNANTHCDHQISLLAAAIKEYGYLVPNVIDDDNNIIAGHGRTRAALLIKRETVPCMKASHLSRAQIAAFRLMDNRLAELSTWDGEMLAVELKALADEDIDLESLGWEQSELDAIAAKIDDPDLDAPIPDDNYVEQYAVMVICDNEADQAEAFEALQSGGYNCKVVTT